MAITASDVNKLRQQTGAGMMDCKNALVESNGDFEAAVDILRKKGQKVAAKRGENEAKEGLVIADTTDGGKTGYVLRLNCETDFVAKNDSFREFVDSLLKVAMANKATSIDALKGMKFNDRLTVDEKITEQVGVVEDAGKQVAMQVAAMNPLSLSKDGIDKETIARELEVGKDLAIQEGKPAEMAEKIAYGRLNKFFKENTLLSQEFIRDNKVSVEEFVASAESGLAVTDYKRLAMS
jgi:elongation factor Ts